MADGIDGKFSALQRRLIDKEATNMALQERAAEAERQLAEARSRGERQAAEAREELRRQLAEVQRQLAEAEGESNGLRADFRLSLNQTLDEAAAK
eukprot:1174304-Prorocentrum_minimum.AAC.1